MIAYKFLNKESLGPFSGFAWPLPEKGAPGAWIRIESQPKVCLHGVHACAIGQLPYWIDAQLWVMELTDPVQDLDKMLVAPGGRLLRRVGSWNSDMVNRFCEACAGRARDHAVGALRSHGLASHARRLAGCEEASSLAAVAAEMAGVVPDWVVDTVAYTRDTAMTVPWGNANIVAYASSVAAGAAARALGNEDSSENAVSNERAWQAAWLDDRLGLKDQWADSQP